MIITRSPLRVSISGGGTDLPEYFKHFGASWVSASVNKYCYTMVNEHLSKEYLIKYSKTESVLDIKQITHPLIRATLEFLKPDNPIELTFSADLPGGTGLGSSAAFTLSLLAALHELRGEFVSAQQLAEEATFIEMEILNEPIGLQDQYASAIGGFKEFKVGKDSSINFSDFPLSSLQKKELNNHLVFIYTGINRKSSATLSEIQKKLTGDEDNIIVHLKKVEQFQVEIKESLLKLDLENYGKILNKYWNKKKKTSSTISNEKIDYLYELGIKNGAYGGKLIGAGGGGFLMFVCKDAYALREVFKLEGFDDIKLEFCENGTETIYRS